MNRSSRIFALLGCCALLSANAPAQHQNYDKATPSAKDKDTTETTSRSDRPAATPRNDQLTADTTRFKALDTDGDKRISRAEFTLAPNLGLQTGNSSDNAAKEDQGEGAARQSSGQVASGVTDSNLTGRQSSSSVALFNEIDTDNDGFISQAELAMHQSSGFPKR